MIERTLKHWRELPNLSIDETATILGISSRMVRNLLDAGELASHNIGRRQFIKVASVQRVAGELQTEPAGSTPEMPRSNLSASGAAALRRLRETG